MRPVTALEALTTLAEGLAAEAAQAEVEGSDASTTQWAHCCFSRAEAFRRARNMAITLAANIQAKPPAGIDPNIDVAAFERSLVREGHM